MSEITHIERKRLVGIRTSIFTIFHPEKYDPAAIPAAWQEFFAKSLDTALASADIFYGASIPSMDLDKPMDYFAGALVGLDDGVPNGFECVEIPEGDYLSVLHSGPISNIAASYQRAYMQEISASGREMRPAPHLEIYPSRKDPMDNDYEMFIAIPVL
jgi:predicted transcriptional regulator YdeE